MFLEEPVNAAEKKLYNIVFLKLQNDYPKENNLLLLFSAYYIILDKAGFEVLTSRKWPCTVYY